jgi:uncharacterized protein YqiB (DUF1249 family)
MALYEGNFIKLTALAPAASLGLAAPGLLREGARVHEGPMGETARSRTSGDLDLHLTVCGVTRYTVDLKLTYIFEEPDGFCADPDLQLRVYLDARMVEVISWSVLHVHEVLRRLAAASSRELDRRWSQNIMLSKWLDYLTDRGHRFPA